MHIKNLLFAVFLLLLIFTIGAFLYQQNDTQPNTSTNIPSQITSSNQHIYRTIPKKNKDTIRKNTDEFYQPIIDNNIFRWLGWKPPKKPVEYILYGTANSKYESNSKAFIYETQSKRLHTVNIGDSIGNATITEIRNKQVTMEKDGKEIKLQGRKMQFLK